MTAEPGQKERHLNPIRNPAKHRISVSDAESPAKIRIDFVIDRLYKAAREGTAKRADAECVAEYCLGRMSVESMCLFVLKEAMSKLNNPAALLVDLKLLLHVLDDDFDKIVASFHDCLIERVPARRDALMSKALSACKADIEAGNVTSPSNSTSEDTESNMASDEGRADPEKQAMRAEIEALKKQLEEKDKPRHEKAPSDDGSVGSMDLIDGGTANAATTREENLKQEIVGMKNTIASLQAELEAAKDGVLAARKEIVALQEGPDTPDTANTRQTMREASVREDSLRKENAEMLNTVAVLRAELKAARDGVSVSTASSSSSSQGTDSAAAAETEDNPGDTTTPATDDCGDDEVLVEDGRDDSFEGLSPTEEVETSIQHTDIPDDDAASDEEDTSVEDENLREKRRNVSNDIVSRLRVEVDKFTGVNQENSTRNLVAVTFPAHLDSVVESAVHWARGKVPIEDILRIAIDLFDLVELNQEVNEQAQLQMSTSNQRIRRGCIGAMIHALNESIGEEDGQSGEELVEAGKRAVADLRMIEDENGSCDTVDELFETTKLGDCGRSILNSLLHLVAVVEALREKEVSTITNFGAQGKGRDNVDRKKADEAALKAAFTDFCPGATWNDCRASVLVSAMTKFLGGKNLDKRRKQLAIAAMGIIFDKRLVLDDDLWAHVDAFSLNGESSEQKFFTVSDSYANRRRYSALHYMLMFCLGNQIGEAIEATGDDSDEFEWLGAVDKTFQQLFLLCSVDKMRKHVTDKSAVKADLFGIGRKGGSDVVSLEDKNTISSVKALLKFMKGRKDGKKDKSESKVPFGADKTILFDLDVLSAAASFDASVDLIERIYSKD